MRHPLVTVTFLLAGAILACRPPRPPADAAAPAPTAPERDTTGVDAALAVVRDYYAAIDARDYRRAHAAWGDDGPPGRPTEAEFAAGFADTDSVRLGLGEPGRVEGAAGSRYVSVPVTVRAFERGGRRTTYTGSYTLRRSVVPGASDANRRWHLYRATLRAEGPPPGDGCPPSPPPRSAVAWQVVRGDSLVVAGRVVAVDSAHPLPGAGVRLLEVGAEQPTDARGAFRLVVPRPGRYTLVARRVGYTVAQGTVDVPRDSAVIALVAMEQRAIVYDGCR